MPNDYSSTWFDLFLRPMPAARTEKEVAFIRRHLPRVPDAAVLDLCCGNGRHAQALAASGYQVVGLDRSAEAIAEARRLSPNVKYMMHDMRRLADLTGRFDAVLSLWQSFGYFDDRTNRDLLRQIHQKLKPRGRLILDVYNRDFFRAHHHGTRHLVREGVPVIERAGMSGDRLNVSLSYDGRPGDTFDWQLYTPDELCELAAACGFACRTRAADFDETIAPASTHPRMQLVLKKTQRH